MGRSPTATSGTRSRRGSPPCRRGSSRGDRRPSRYPVRRSPEREGAQRFAELLLDVLGRKLEGLEDPRWVASSCMRMLPPPISNPFSTRSYARSGGPRGQIVGGGRGERMVHRDPPVLLVAVLEQRRLDHPAERPGIVGDQPEPRRHLAAETVERHVDPVLLVGDDADEVAVGRAGPLHAPSRAPRRRNFSTGERIEPSEPTAIQTSPAAPRPWHPRSIGRAPCARRPRARRRAP